VDVTIDRMRWWDIEALEPIEAQLFGDDRWSAAMFWNELASGHHYLVAREGDDVVGYAGIAVGEREAWVQNLAVRADRQRAGIGTRLLEALLAEADRHGVPAVLLEVAVDNAPAQRLYDRYGFEPVGIRRGYYQPSNTDAVVMRRDG
jgi:[ribosomal protein S18]-alanine N-acetyltransferase